MGVAASAGRLWRVLRRSAFFVLGWLCVGLGLIGLAVPLMPSTTFFVLAALLFARSSPRFRAMILDHPRIGPPVRNFLTHRVIPRYAKVAAGFMLFASIVILVMTGAGWTSIAIAVGAAFLVMAYMLPKPSRPPAPPIMEAQA